MSKELQKYDIEAPSKMAAMATVLKTHVVQHQLYTNIKGKNYAHVEGWQFAGGLMGLVPEVVRVDKHGQDAWFAEVQIVRLADGKVMSRGFALCSSKEATKKSFDEYAVLSMAQTRAIGKAYRNLIGWVMKLAGYEGTPSEEMRKVGEQPAEPEVQVPADIKDYACAHKSCGTELTKAEHDYSKKLYGKPLCRPHQREAKAAK